MLLGKEPTKNQFQELAEENDVNPNGDNYGCQQILNQLESDCFKVYNHFIDGEARKNRP